jgi:hypothetical protein
LLRRFLKGKEITNGSYRVLPPAHVLHRVNCSVVAADLAECLFITGLHAVYYEPARTLTFARGGLPYPILLRAGCAPQQLVSQGPLMGAFDDAVFETMRVYLEPGDAMIFYTDGLEALLLKRTGPEPIDSINETPWYGALEASRVFAAHDAIERQLDLAGSGDWPVDDLTLITLRATP